MRQYSLFILFFFWGSAAFFYSSVSKKKCSCIQEYACFRLPPAWYAGLRSIVADYYWFYSSTQGQWPAPLFFSYADFITDLDPYCTPFYRYAAVRLFMDTQGGGLALNVLEKSLHSAVNSADWRIYFYLAYGSYLLLHERQRAHYLLSLAAQQHKQCTLFFNERSTKAPPWAYKLVA